MSEHDGNTIMKRKKFLVNTAFFAVIGIGIFALFKLLPFVFPFVIGFGAARAVLPAADAVSRRTKLPQKAARIICLTLFLIVILLVAAFLLILLADGLAQLIKEMPDVLSGLPAGIMSLYERFMTFAEGISPELAIRLADTAASLTESATVIPQELILGLLKYIYGILTGVPTVLISVGVGIVSAYLFVTDMPHITNFVTSRFPDVFSGRSGDTMRETGRSVFRLLTAYLKLMGITCAELLLGFFLLKIPFPFTLAVMIAVIDILPVLGVGTVLIPWGIVLILLGDPSKALGLFLLYAVITVVRSATEPKIVGDHIDLHPIVTLLCIFLGLQLGGILGMFTLPVVAIAAARYLDSGAKKNKPDS